MGRNWSRFLTTAKGQFARRHKPKPNRLPLAKSRFWQVHHAECLIDRLQTGSLSIRKPWTAMGELLKLAAPCFMSPMAKAPRNANDSGVANTVIIDLALDYQHSHPTCHFSCRAMRPGSRSSRNRLTTSGWFYCFSLSPMFPGLAVMRTVAMLANETADAVNQRCLLRSSR